MNPGAGCDVLCPHSLEKLDGSTVAGKDNKDVPKAAEANECTLGPITPDSDREHGDIHLDFKFPVTVAKKQLKLSSNGNDNGNKVAFVHNCSPQTPKDGVFDPFAPGPDDMARAPQCRKYLDELRDSVSRQLKFDPCDLFEIKNSGYDVESLSDQEMFESVYENLLEAFVSMQTEDVLAEMENVEHEPVNCKTPPSELQCSRISDTYPDAPLKPRGTPRIIPVELCRKLEF